MTPRYINMIASSKDAALVISLVFNVVILAAFWRLWRSREALQDKVTGLMLETVKEVTKLMVKLMERGK